MDQVRDYLHGAFTQVDGWCIPQLWQAIQPLHEVQERNGISGPVAEIGVYHGKFFIGLMKTKSTARNFAIDVFAMQRFNLDGAGEGNLEKVRSNISMSGSSLEDVHFVEADSMALTSDDVRRIREESQGGFSMFSVDGCHDVEHTINDTEIAMQLTMPGGIIFVDDYYNANWPGVQEGIAKMYLTGAPRFVPLIATCNKLILCHLSYHGEYLSYLAKHMRDYFPDTRIKPVRRFGYDTLTAIPDLANGKYVTD